MPLHPTQSALRHPLTQILGSNAHVRTLRVLFEHGGELPAPSIVDRTDLAKASVANALNALERFSIVRRIGFGRSILYRAEMRHPLAPSLAALFDSENARFVTILDRLGEIARQSDALAAWLYGSAARGEDTALSDVDIAVVVGASVGPQERENIRERMTGAGDDLCFLASITILDEKDILRLSSQADPWWVGVAQDSQVLVGDSPERLATRLQAAHRPNLKKRK